MTALATAGSSVQRMPVTVRSVAGVRKAEAGHRIPGSVRHGRAADEALGLPGTDPPRPGIGRIESAITGRSARRTRGARSMRQ